MDTPQVWVAQIGPERLGQRAAIPRSDQGTSYPIHNRVGAAGDPRRNHGQSHRGRLEWHHWEPFAVRGQNHYVHGGVQARGIPVQPNEVNAGIRSEGELDVLGKWMFRLNGPDREQVKIVKFGPQLAPRVNELDNSLLTDQASYEADDAAVVADAVLFAAGSAHREIRRLESGVGIHPIDAAAEEHPDFLRRTYPFRDRYFS